MIQQKTSLPIHMTPGRQLPFDHLDMPTFHRYSLVKLFLLSLGLVALLNSAILWGFWYYESWQRFTAESEQIRKRFLDQKKTEVIREIQSAKEFIEFKRQQVKVRTRQLLKFHVREAAKVAQHLFATYTGLLPEQEVHKLIREALRPFRFNQNRGYYFATDLSGIEQIFADKPEMEGLDFSQMRDSRGVPIIQEMIHLAKTRGSGFYSYTWSKPNSHGRHHAKLSYIQLIPELGWFIGGGEYLSDMEQEIKNEVLQRLQNLSFGNNGYIFVLDQTSRMLAHRLHPELVGRVMNDEKSPTLNSLFPKLQATAQETGSGFYHYNWAKPDGTISEKVTYVSTVDGWNWLLGAGFHMDDAEALILERKHQLQKKIRRDLTVTGILLGGLFLLVLGVSQWLRLHTSRTLNAFNDFFSEAATKAQILPQEQVVFREFDSIARSANLMIQERRHIEEEKRRLEDQLLQRQKLEAIGTLAGGIAHDFNNLLAAMFGNINMLQLKIRPGDQLHHYVENLSKSAIRAKDLVQQILCFSRPSAASHQLFDLARTVTESIGLLRSSLPSTVVLEIDTPTEICPVTGNPTQIHQVVMNICTNAYQAFTDGVGTIKIRLQVVEQANGQPPGFSLTIDDNGPGIPPEILPRIFDPFYTTKEVGQGTGLGLSVVHSIVLSHKGSISVSQLNPSGIRFNVFLPRSEDGAIPDTRTTTAPPTTGLVRGTIMLVDDEPGVLNTMADLLEQLGYTVESFSNPFQALTRLETEGKGMRIDLLLTDLTMPGMTGQLLAEKAKGLSPGLPVLLYTGYPERVQDSGHIDRVLHKPVQLAELEREVNDLIARTTPEN